MVAVIIPVKNHANYLRRAVTSALEAESIIIISDHSTDDSRQVAKHLSDEFANVTLIDSPGAGVVAARNAGIAHTSENLIVPLDADDYFVPGGLNILADAWKSGTWVYSDYYVQDRGETARKFAPPPGVLRRKNICHATICMSKADWATVGGYDPAFEICCEDWALTIALTLARVHPVRVTQPTYIKTATGGRGDQCRRHAREIRKLLAQKYGREYA